MIKRKVMKMFHIIPGNLRAVVDDNGRVEQWVDYHSGGLPSTTAPTLSPKIKSFLT